MFSGKKAQQQDEEKEKEIPQPKPKPSAETRVISDAKEEVKTEDLQPIDAVTELAKVSEDEVSVTFIVKLTDTVL